MNRRHIWLVFHKECIDFARDRKTWIGTFLIPLVVIPLVVSLLGASMAEVRKEAREHMPLIVKGNTEHPLVKSLQQNPAVQLLQKADPVDALRKGQVRAVIELPPDLERKLQAHAPTEIKVWYDPSNQKSEYARTEIEKVINQFEKAEVHNRLRKLGLSEQIIDPLTVAFESVATEERMSGSILSGMITLMLVLSLSSGGLASATDLVAGEKERGTLEMLISTPIAPSSILTAKLLAVMLISCTSALASLLSITIIFSTTAMGGEEAKLTLRFFTPQSVTVLIIMILLLSAMFAGMQLTISTLAKSFKESQTYMTPIAFGAMVPSYMMMPLNPVDIPFYYFLLPIFNGVALFKEIFYGELDMIHALSAIFSSLVFVTISISLAARFFKRANLIVK